MHAHTCDAYAWPWRSCSCSVVRALPRLYRHDHGMHHDHIISVYGHIVRELYAPKASSPSPNRSQSQSQRQLCPVGGPCPSRRAPRWSHLTRRSRGHGSPHHHRYPSAPHQQCDRAPSLTPVRHVVTMVQAPLTMVVVTMVAQARAIPAHEKLRVRSLGHRLGRQCLLGRQQGHGLRRRQFREW